MTGRSIASSSRRRAAAKASATSCRRYCPGRPVRWSTTRRANSGHDRRLAGRAGGRRRGPLGTRRACRQRRIQFPRGGPSRHAARSGRCAEHRADDLRPERRRHRGQGPLGQDVVRPAVGGDPARMYKARARGETASLADVAYALSDPDEASDALWEEMRTNRHLQVGMHPVVAAAGRDQLDRPEGNAAACCPAPRPT